MDVFKQSENIQELEAIVAELERLPDSSANRAILYHQRRELRYWRARKSFFERMVRLGLPVPRGVSETDKALP